MKRNTGHVCLGKVEVDNVEASYRLPACVVRQTYTSRTSPHLTHIAVGMGPLRLYRQQSERVIILSAFVPHYTQRRSHSPLTVDGRWELSHHHIHPHRQFLDWWCRQTIDLHAQKVTLPSVSISKCDPHPFPLRTHNRLAGISRNTVSRTSTTPVCWTLCTARVPWKRPLVVGIIVALRAPHATADGVTSACVAWLLNAGSGGMRIMERWG